MGAEKWSKITFTQCAYTVDPVHVVAYCFKNNAFLLSFDNTNVVI